MSDEASARLLIGPQNGEHVSITVVRRESPDSQSDWDGNWIICRIELRVGAFRAEYDALLRSEEFPPFRDALRTLYEELYGGAAFHTMEGWLSIDIHGDGRGHFVAKCDATDQPGIGNKLSFQLELDQTEIPTMLEGIDRILREFAPKPPST